MADELDAVPTTGTEDPAAARRRPWRITYAGGRCLTTYRYQDHALIRAAEEVRSGRLDTVWVHERGSTNMLTVTTKRNQHPGTVD